MYEHPMQEQRSPFFVLSFILHLLLLYLCYQLLSYHKTAQKAAKNPLEAIKALDFEPERAEMKAAQSAFGAPVIFQDMPEFTQMDAAQDEDDTEGAQKLAQTAKKDVSLQSTKEPLQKDIESKIVQQSFEVPTEPSNKYLAQTQETENETSSEQQEKPAGQKKPQKKVTTLAKEHAIAQRLRKRRTTDSGGKVAAPTPKNLTFADLANGFLENLKNGGKDAINQRGNPNRRPTYKDLQYVSYKQQLAWHLQAAFKRAPYAEFMVPAPERSELICTLVVVKDGRLDDVRIRQSTNHVELDTYIIKIIQDAFPIPPIPKHWEKEELVMDWRFSNIHPKYRGYYHISF